MSHDETDEAAPEGAFRFPSHMTVEEAGSLLREAYGEIDAGKVLRKALREQRGEGWDPPHDVQYSAEPAVAEFGPDLGVSIQTEIYTHESFEGMDACTDIFERAVAHELIERLERKVARWSKRRPDA